VSLRHEVAIPVDLPSAFAYLVAAVAVGALTRRRPALGVAALVLIAPFALARWVGPTTITLIKAGVLGMVVAFAFGRPSFAPFGTRPVRLVGLGFGLVIAATLATIVTAEHQAPVIRETLKAIEYAVLFGAAVMAFANDPDDRPFWWALEVGTLLVCFSAIAEYAIGAHSGIFIAGHAVPRIAGVLEGPNQLSGWLEIVIPVLLARALLHRDAWLVALIIFASAVDVLTFSRAGLVSLAIAIFVVLRFMHAPARNAVRLAVVAAIAIVTSLGFAFRSGLPENYFSLDQETQAGDHLANRAQLWHAAITLWSRSPILGVGAGNYELDLGEVGLAGVRTHANSVYLQSLAEGGVVLLAAMLAQLAILLTVLGRSGVRRPLVVGAFAGAVALACHQIFDDLMFFTKVGSIFWLVMGVATAEIAARRLFERRTTERAAAA
jgi:O-antigen ligase